MRLIVSICVVALSATTAFGQAKYGEFAQYADAPTVSSGNVAAVIIRRAPAAEYPRTRIVLEEPREYRPAPEQVQTYQEPQQPPRYYYKGGWHSGWETQGVNYAPARYLVKGQWRPTWETYGASTGRPWYQTKWGPSPVWETYGRNPEGFARQAIRSPYWYNGGPRFLPPNFGANPRGLWQGLIPGF